MYTKRDSIRGGFNKHHHRERSKYSNTRQVLGHSIPWFPRCLRRILYKCSLTVGKRSAAVVFAAQRRRHPPLPCSAPAMATYMQQSALSESQLSVRLRRFTRRRAEATFSSMWSVYSLVFITCCRTDPVSDLYRSNEDSTYRCKLAWRCVGSLFSNIGLSLPSMLCEMTLRLTV